MYLDCGCNKCTVFSNDKETIIFANSLHKICELIIETFKVKDGDKIYIDNRGYGIAYINEFETLGITVDVMKYKVIDC